MKSQKKNDFKEGINWYGWTTPFSGYGVVTLEYIVAINKLIGDKLSVGWQRQEPSKSQEFSILTKDQRYLVSQKPYQKERLGICKVTPEYFYVNESDIKIGYTMVENTRVGDKWVKTINGMNACLVPSKYLVNVFKESGITIPVYPVRQGINPKLYPYFERKKKDKFIFGTCGWLDERKNWKEMCIAFASEFSDDEPVELWLKNSNNTFGFEQPEDPRIKFIDELWDFKQMNKFYQDLDCFLFCTRAEGAGMPAREAMATGCPVILTNWGGLADICDPKYNFPVDPVAVDLPDYRGDEQPGFQARIDVQEIMYWMRYAYENWKESMARGKAASEWMHKEWTWEKCAEEVVELLQKEFQYE